MLVRVLKMVAVLLAEIDVDRNNRQPVPTICEIIVQFCHPKTGSISLSKTKDLRKQKRVTVPQGGGLAVGWRSGCCVRVPAQCCAASGRPRMSCDKGFKSSETP